MTARILSYTICLVLALMGLRAHAQATVRDGYTGTITKSDDRKVGAQFTFANLRSSKPFVTFPGGNGNEVSKVFENGELIVLVFVASLTGSTESFYLSKSRGQFTLVEVGALEATVRGTEFRPTVTYGNLQ